MSTKSLGLKLYTPLFTSVSWIRLSWKLGGCAIVNHLGVRPRCIRREPLVNCLGVISHITPSCIRVCVRRRDRRPRPGITDYSLKAPTNAWVCWRSDDLAGRTDNTVPTFGNSYDNGKCTVASCRTNTGRVRCWHHWYEGTNTGIAREVRCRFTWGIRSWIRDRRRRHQSRCTSQGMANDTT